MVKIVEYDRLYTDEQAEVKFKGKFLKQSDCKIIVTEDTDGYDNYNNLLFKFRKGVLPIEILELGVNSFRKSIELTESRGTASGSSHKRIKKDGSVSKITVGNKVLSGAVGFADPAAMIPYCRKTGFTRKYFEEFTKGIPFVKTIDKFYKELIPEKYAIQKQYAEGTNQNYVIADTAFTTVTVNKDFVTGVHKDAGDHPDGFGNLIVYRKGNWKGCNFTLPEFGVGIDMQNTDILMVDVHKWHGNTPFQDWDEETCERISFVLYYRQYMLQCSSPEEELIKIKLDKNGFFRL